MMAEGSSKETKKRAFDPRFIEIEHKFLVAGDFEPSSMFQKIQTEEVIKHYRTEVQDTYYLVRAAEGSVYRHRLDSSLQQLTLKSLAADNESRTEVNLDLGLAKGDQRDAIAAFMEPLGILWCGTLCKSLEVYYLKDVELCFYRAQYAGKQVACIEIEARTPSSFEAAEQSLKAWEQRLGLRAEERCRASLLELLIVPTLSPELQLRLQKWTASP